MINDDQFRHISSTKKERSLLRLKIFSKLEIKFYRIFSSYLYKNIYHKEISLLDWCWSWNSNTLATSWEELTHWKIPWYCKRLRAEGEGDNRAWDGWMASPIQWTWVWVDSGSWWWTGSPGVLRFMGSQSRTQLSDWTEMN